MPRVPQSKNNATPLQQFTDTAYDNVVICAENIDAIIAAAGATDVMVLYLGAHPTNPTEGKDGAPLVSGNFYLNTTSSSLVYYDAENDTWVESDVDTVVTAARDAEAARDAAQAAQAAASTSASNASASAGQAASSASAAALSESNAATSESNASVSEGNAATSANNAANSATAALASENAASTSETNAATSETNSANSASASAASESNAAASAVSAANSASQAEAAFDNFDDMYLGRKTVEPTVDNDGNPLQVGASYWHDNGDNTGEQRFWNGASWESPELTATQAAQQAIAARDDAQVSETNAANSATAAAASASDALASEQAASAAASEASILADEAAASEQAAFNSASNAATYASNAATSETNAAQSATDAQQSADDAAAIVPSLQAQIDNRIDKDTTTLSEAEVDGLFAAGKVEIERTDSNLTGIAGTRSLLHIPNGQGGFQLAARSLGSEIHVRAAHVGDGTIGPWERIYTTGYKPSPSDIGALPDSGTAVAADKWATPRTVTVDGDVDGSVTIDGSSDETLTTTVNPYIVWKTAQMDINDDVQRSVYFILADYYSGGFIGKIISHRCSGNTTAFQFDVHAVKSTTAGDNGSYYARGEMTQGNFDVSIVRVTHEGVEKLALKFADIPPYQKPKRASFFNAAPDMGTHEVICVTDDKITNEQPVVVSHNSQEKVWGIENTYFDGGIVVNDGVIAKEIVVLDGGSPSGSHAIRRDWAEANLLRRSVQSVTSSLDWNTLYRSGHSAVYNGTGSNRPATSLTGSAYSYGSLLAMSHNNTNSGVKTQLFFPHNQNFPDAASRLPFYRTGHTGDYGTWRTLLSLQYADNRYTQISSDKHLKTNIKGIEGALELVNKIGTYSYTKENAEVTQIIREDGEYTGSDEHYRFEMGFIAQEIEKVFPHLVHDDVHGYKAIKTDDNTLIAVAYKAIQELSSENSDLRNEVDELKSELALIKKHLGL